MMMDDNGSFRMSGLTSAPWRMIDANRFKHLFGSKAHKYGQLSRQSGLRIEGYG